MSDVFKYVKPILKHAFKTPHTTHCYDTLLGNCKLPDPKYLSKKAKSIYTKEINEAMREENERADFFRVYSDSTTESVWETQWKKDLIQRRNKIKSHTAQLKNYKKPFPRRMSRMSLKTTSRPLLTTHSRPPILHTNLINYFENPQRKTLNTSAIRRKQCTQKN